MTKCPNRIISCLIKSKPHLYTAFIMSCSSLRRSDMTRVNTRSHSFTCHPHVYPQVEWAIYLPLLPSCRASHALRPVLISHPAEGRRLSWPGWVVTYSDGIPRIWIWINNWQNLRWSITSMSVLRCLWHGAQLRLKCRDSVCVHCRLEQRIPRPA